MILLLMAAGRSSRYGKLKQFDPLGPTGEFLMEFSIYDAIANGFDHIIIITQKDKKEFTENYFQDKINGTIKLDVITQDIYDVPSIAITTFVREKPWGTAHAVWAARNLIDQPFAVLNADDFYGFSAYEKAASFLKTNHDNNCYGLIGYHLKDTLSEYGPVSRGVCTFDNHTLKSIEECTKLEMQNDEIVALDTLKTYHEDTLVSMNFWLLKPSIFKYIETHLKAFLQDAKNSASAELYLPVLLNEELANKTIKIDVIDSESKWFGVTYANDREAAVNLLNNACQQGIYPVPLWKKPLNYLKTDQLHTVLNSFEIDTKKYKISELSNGLINDTYLISDGQKPLYVLQRINDTVFKNIEGLMANMTLALTYLKSKSYCQIQVIPTVNNKMFLKKANEYWRLMTYLPNSTTFNTTTNSSVAFEAGRVIGDFHKLMQNATSQLNEFHETIPNFHDLKSRENQFYDALANAETAKKTTAHDVINFTKQMLHKLNNFQQMDLPIRICHNDTKLNNILFSKDNNKALCLIDLDTLMKGYFYYDFGDAIRTIVNSANEDEKDHSKITFDKKMFESFVIGLKDSGIIFTENELKSMPFGVVLMPFLHGIRALTDYLNNNKYYKVLYENQNLDRSLSLFYFAQKAYDQMEYMQMVLSQKLNSYGTQ